MVIVSLIISLTISLPVLYETCITHVSTVNYRDSDVEVIVHTSLYHNRSYTVMFRRLFSFSVSQVVTLWFLPVLSCLSLQHLRRTDDLLTPLLSLTSLILLTPSLLTYLEEILLYQPNLSLHLTNYLALSLLSAIKPVFYLLDNSVKRSNFDRKYKGRTIVPQDDYF